MRKKITFIFALLFVTFTAFTLSVSANGENDAKITGTDSEHTIGGAKSAVTGKYASLGYLSGLRITFVGDDGKSIDGMSYDYIAWMWEYWTKNETELGWKTTFYYDKNETDKNKITRQTTGPSWTSTKVVPNDFYNSMSHLQTVLEKYVADSTVSSSSIDAANKLIEKIKKKNKQNTGDENAIGVANTDIFYGTMATWADSITTANNQGYDQAYLNTVALIKAMGISDDGTNSLLNKLKEVSCGLGQNVYIIFEPILSYSYIGDLDSNGKTIPSTSWTYFGTLSDFTYLYEADLNGNNGSPSLFKANLLSLSNGREDVMEYFTGLGDDTTKQTIDNKAYANYASVSYLADVATNSTTFKNLLKPRNSTIGKGIKGSSNITKMRTEGYQVGVDWLVPGAACYCEFTSKGVLKNSDGNKISSLSGISYTPLLTGSDYDEVAQYAFDKEANGGKDCCTKFKTEMDKDNIKESKVSTKVKNTFESMCTCQWTGTTQDGSGRDGEGNAISGPDGYAKYVKDCLCSAKVVKTNDLTSCCDAGQENNSKIEEIASKDLFCEDPQSGKLTPIVPEDYEYDKTVINEYCTMYCTETMEIKTPGEPQVKATFFKFKTNPTASGTRTCSVLVDNEKLKKDLDDLSDLSVNGSTAEKDDANSKITEITKKNGLIDQCKNSLKTVQYDLSKMDLSAYYKEAYIDDEGKSVVETVDMAYDKSCTYIDKANIVIKNQRGTNSNQTEDTYYYKDKNGNNKSVKLFYYADATYTGTCTWTTKAKINTLVGSGVKLTDLNSTLVQYSKNNYTQLEGWESFELRAMSGNFLTYFEFKNVGHSTGTLNDIYKKTKVKNCADNTVSANKLTCTYPIADGLYSTGHCPPENPVDKDSDLASCDSDKVGKSGVNFKLVDPSNLFPNESASTEVTYTKSGNNDDYAQNWLVDNNGTLEFVSTKVEIEADANSDKTYASDHVTYAYTLTPSTMSAIRQYNSSYESLGGYAYSSNLICECPTTVATTAADIETNVCNKCKSSFLKGLADGSLETADGTTLNINDNKGAWIPVKYADIDASRNTAGNWR